MVNSCPTCGDEFDGQRGVRVHHSRVHDEKLPNRECAACGTRFFSEHSRKYCSTACRETASSFSGEDNPNYSGGRDETTCSLCGQRFEYYSSAKEGLYCPDCVESESWRDPPSLTGDENPQWDGGTQEYDCAVCGSTVSRYPSDATGEIAVCSETCRREWLSEAFSGDGHPNWRGGGNEAYGPGWASVRREALERDGFECVQCGTTAAELGRNPDVHHIVPVRVFQESDTHELTDAHTLDNVVSLCISCHRKAEFGHISKSSLRSAIGAD